jgi:hypothetical protein
LISQIIRLISQITRFIREITRFIGAIKAFYAKITAGSSFSVISFSLSVAPAAIYKAVYLNKTSKNDLIRRVVGC